MVIIDDFEPEFTEEALELLLKYGFYCCVSEKYRDFKWKNIKTYNDIEKNLEKLLPNAYNNITCMAQDYGLENINPELVHAYFFTLHNNIHEKEGNLEHKAYIGIVKKIYEGNKEALVKIKGSEKEEMLVLNLYNYPLNENVEVIIHAGYIVTTKVPEEIRRLSCEKDIRAWESYIGRRQHSYKNS